MIYIQNQYFSIKYTDIMKIKYIKILYNLFYFFSYLVFSEWNLRLKQNISSSFLDVIPYPIPLHHFISIYTNVSDYILVELKDFLKVITD